MLSEMKAEIFAARAIALANAAAIDMASATGDAAWDARAALLTPVTKAYGTETGIKVAQMGIQVHGGMGFIEETGAAQYLRDVRVTAIYEGTNGIQAMDLVARKMMDGGAAMFALLDEVDQTAKDAGAEGARLLAASGALREATEKLVAMEMNDRFAGAVPYLMAVARVLGGHFHLRAALADEARLKLARVFLNRLLPEAHSLLEQAAAGADDLYALSAEELSA